MKHKTADLEGALLDAAVAKAEGITVRIVGNTCLFHEPGRYGDTYAPSRLWTQGGPIIDMHLQGVERFKGDDMSWIASYGDVDCPRSETGPTVLVAAMRAYVASKLGDEVDL